MKHHTFEVGDIIYNTASISVWPLTIVRFLSDGVFVKNMNSTNSHFVVSNKHIGTYRLTPAVANRKLMKKALGL